MRDDGSRLFEVPKKLPEYRSKTIRVFRHHEMPGIELDELSVGYLRLNAFGDSGRGDVVFCADHDQGGRLDTRELSMDIELRHRRQRLADDGVVPGRNAVEQGLIDCGGSVAAESSRRSCFSRPADNPAACRCSEYPCREFIAPSVVETRTSARTRSE